MDHSLCIITSLLIALPFLGFVLAWCIPKQYAPCLSVFVVVCTFLLSAFLGYAVFAQNHVVHCVLYTWASFDFIVFPLNAHIDSLSVALCLLVTCIGTLVSVYSLEYMRHDPGKRRFFSYILLFTGMMLILTVADNFLQLFLGWEGVGLTSYLLIGFWYDKPSAVQGSLKAFVVNRIGDIGFILGIALIFAFCGSVQYDAVIQHIPMLTHTTLGFGINLSTCIGVLLFFGVAAKSAQIPLHIWLPESMEGPTPISALIHAATMVTAGVFVLVRLAPLFVSSATTQHIVLVVGASTALYTGLLALIECDLKRVIAYSTMSQLGYMVSACGVAAHQSAFTHLLMHGFFKSLLFLSAGAVILALHHQQNIRRMGGLAQYLPWVNLSFLVGALSLSAIPPLSGFYSKDAVIHAVQAASAQDAVARYAYWCLLLGTFVTAYYIFRAYWMTFYSTVHTKPEGRSTLWIVAPLIFLCIPSIVLGAVLTPHAHTMLHDAFRNWSFWFAALGVFLSWLHVLVWPKIPIYLKQCVPIVHYILTKQYGFNFLSQLSIRFMYRLSHFLSWQCDWRCIHCTTHGMEQCLMYGAKKLRGIHNGSMYRSMLFALIGLMVILLIVIVE